MNGGGSVPNVENEFRSVFVRFVHFVKSLINRTRERSYRFAQDCFKLQNQEQEQEQEPGKL